MSGDAGVIDVRALEAAGDVDAAIALARRARAHDATAPAPLFSLCRLLLARRDPEAASLLPMLERFPGFAPGWHELGTTLRALGRAEAAAVAFARAAAAAPDFAPAWFALGLVRHDLRDHAGAVAAYRRALAARPDLHEAALNLGAALQEVGDLDAALDAYAEAYRLHPPSFGRIAQAIVAAPTGILWLDPERLRATLAQRESRHQ